jgi:hypothetical protein
VYQDAKCGANDWCIEQWKMNGQNIDNPLCGTKITLVRRQQCMPSPGPIGVAEPQNFISKELRIRNPVGTPGYDCGHDQQKANDRAARTQRFRTTDTTLEMTPGTIGFRLPNISASQ